jgi:hypothetical protein
VPIPLNSIWTRRCPLGHLTEGSEPRCLSGHATLIRPRSSTQSTFCLPVSERLILRIGPSGHLPDSLPKVCDALDSAGARSPGTLARPLWPCRSMPSVVAWPPSAVSHHLFPNTQELTDREGVFAIYPQQPCSTK